MAKATFAALKEHWSTFAETESQRKRAEALEEQVEYLEEKLAALSVKKAVKSEPKEKKEEHVSLAVLNEDLSDSDESDTYRGRAPNTKTAASKRPARKVTIVEPKEQEDDEEEENDAEPKEIGSEDDDDEDAGSDAGSDDEGSDEEDEEEEQVDKKQPVKVEKTEKAEKKPQVEKKAEKKVEKKSRAEKDTIVARQLDRLRAKYRKPLGFEVLRMHDLKQIVKRNGALLGDLRTDTGGCDHRQKRDLVNEISLRVFNKPAYAS